MRDNSPQRRKKGEPPQSCICNLETEEAVSAATSARRLN